MSANLIHAEQEKFPLNYGTTTAMLVFHAGAIAALFLFSWQALAMTVLFWWIAGGLGIGIGYHRLLTHRGYKTPKWMEYFLTVCGMLALEGGAINWVATHRIHHKHTEEVGHDPHTPREGLWWAHMGWILRGTGQQYDAETLDRFAPDLTRDPVHVFLNRFYYVPLVLQGLLMLAVGGWSMLMWGVFFRVTFGLHMTWLVNSATHKWGSRRFTTGDDSTNNFLVALVTFGEGWHNNHHAHPTAARHGVRWYEIDFNWYGIRALEILGLAKNIKFISKQAVRDADAKPTPADAVTPIEVLSKAA